MILIVSEHLKEIELLINHYKLKKKDGIFKNDALSVFVNYGQGSLALSYSVANIISIYNDIEISVLFGIAGSVGKKFKVGDFCTARRVKLMDKSLNPVFNPIDMANIADFKSADIVTLLEGVNFDNEYLSKFADLIDNEAYFFAKAVKSLNKFGIILKTVSDTNKLSELRDIRKNPFDYDLNRLVNFVDRLIDIDKNSIKIEILKNTGFIDKNIVDKLCKIIEKKRLSFSNRQKLYKKIKLNKHMLKTEQFEKPLIVLEKNIDRSRIKINLSKFNVKEVNDYVPYFHNMKDRKAVIFANKKGEFLRKTPNHYTPDGESGYSILNAYNCVYDCSYCFLKGYFKSFNPVIFLNYEDYFKEIERVVKYNTRRPLYFFAGTFSDTVALSYLSDFNIKLVEFFSHFNDDIYLELRTKSDRIEDFISIVPSKNIIMAFSLSPNSVVKKFENLTPSFEARMKAIKKLDELGFKIGIRIDPVIFDYLNEYGEVFDSVKLIKNLHSVEVGFLRFDKNGYKNMLNKNPNILKDLQYENKMYRYGKKIRMQAEDFIKSKLDNFYMSME